MSARLLLQLTDYLTATCPHAGINAPDLGDRTTWSILFLPEATPQQRTAANEALLNWTPPTPAWRGSSLQFIERFTDAEQLAIVTATLTNAAVKLWYDKMLAADEVIADDPRTVAGMDFLVTAGLLTQARRDAILGV